MRVLDTASNRRAVTAYGSAGVRLGVLARARDVQVSTALLDPGGVIGRHPTPSTQLLLVVSGRVLVSGQDGHFEALTAGRAVVWDAGEEHETRSPDGATVVLVEGDF